MSTWPNDPGDNARYKVAIPRITGKPPQPKRRRVARACDACRQIKLKCNGQRPSCEYCASIGKPCLYSASKREARQISFQRLEERIKDYESVLGDIILQCPQKNLKPILNMISVSLPLFSCDGVPLPTMDGIGTFSGISLWPSTIIDTLVSAKLAQLEVQSQPRANAPNVSGWWVRWRPCSSAPASTPDELNTALDLAGRGRCG